jgi:hypothetical protein
MRCCRIAAFEDELKEHGVDSEASSIPWFLVALLAFAIADYIAMKMPM